MDYFKFLEFVGKILGSKIEEKNGTLSVCLKDKGNAYTFSTDASELRSILSSVQNNTSEKETALCDDTTYEILIDIEPGTALFNIRSTQEDKIAIDDPDNQISYLLSSPSDRYMVFILDRIRERDANFSYFSIPESLKMRLVSEAYARKNDLLSLLKFVFYRFRTVKISSAKEQKPDKFSVLLSSFIYDISYNLGFAIVELPSLDDYLRINRIVRIRRSEIGELDPPRRQYIPEIVYQYQMALATDSVLLQYISYYNILAYFYDEMYAQDMIESVKKELADPGFSFKRKNDIGKLISMIRNKTLSGAEHAQTKESRSLFLTLKAYVDTGSLKEQLDAFDPELVPYYKEHKVEFSNGNRIDFAASDSNTILTDIAERLCKTRNAIVNGNEGNAAYFPFRDDVHLIREIPLLRFIAESILLNSSKLL